MSGRQDSNLRPDGPKPPDLPTDLLPEIKEKLWVFQGYWLSAMSDAYLLLTLFQHLKHSTSQLQLNCFSFAVHTRIELVAQHRQCRMLAITPMDQLWSRRDSNPHPLPCKGSAQPVELQPHLLPPRDSNPN